MFLSDSELIRRLEPPKPIINGLELGAGKDRYVATSPVQPCSVDLHIGGIFLPGMASDKPGSAGMPLEGLELEPGKTAVVKTLEECDFPSNIGGFGFPPNTVSSKGILMTNPGHVDPGYRGTMDFTVINMGSENYSLRRGNKIVSLLIFQLDRPAVKNLSERGVEPVDNVAALLAVLSPDFLNIRGRIKAASEVQEEVTRRAALRAPIYLGVLTIIATTIVLVLGSGLVLRGEISDLKARTDETVSIEKLEARVRALEGKSAEHSGGIITAGRGSGR